MFHYIFISFKFQEITNILIKRIDNSQELFIFLLLFHINFNKVSEKSKFFLKISNMNKIKDKKNDFYRRK